MADIVIAVTGGKLRQALNEPGVRHVYDDEGNPIPECDIGMAAGALFARALITERESAVLSDTYFAEAIAEAKEPEDDAS